uniref:Bcl-2 Bcl-2 homology region 1-3 domain-containing protein n=1 Tax=Scophthalmus maximus TaxID=52904 RepID=A0A8D3CTR5_SCOMX
MSDSNRELVEFFIGYKLSQRNYPTSLLRPEDAGGRTEGDKANSAASNGLLVDGGNRDSAHEFEQLFNQAFSDLSLQLDITPDTAYQSFKSVMDEVFKDGVNWGRIVGLFAFGGVLCVECVEKNRGELVARIADWMTMYLDEHISPWIQSQGGWGCFAEIFGQGAGAEARRYRESVRRWLLVGVGMLTGVLIAMFIAKKQ